MTLEVLSKLLDFMINPTMAVMEVMWKGKERYPDPDGLQTTVPQHLAWLSPPYPKGRHLLHSKKLGCSQQSTLPTQLFHTIFTHGVFSWFNHFWLFESPELSVQKVHLRNFILQVSSNHWSTLVNLMKRLAIHENERVTKFCSTPSYRASSALNASIHLNHQCEGNQN